MDKKETQEYTNVLLEDINYRLELFIKNLEYIGNVKDLICKEINGILEK